MTTGRRYLAWDEPVSPDAPPGQPAQQKVLRVIKDEPGTRIEVRSHRAGPVVVKTYFSGRLKRLQSFLVASRAEREFRNLTRVAAAGIPCTEAVGWRAERSLGCVPSCTVQTRYSTEAVTLPEVLAEADPAERRQWVRKMGMLLRQLHDRGILWGTSYPRNILVAGDELMVCDLPCALCYGQSVAHTLAASTDFYDLAFSPSRRTQFTAGERWRMTLAYCTDDGDDRPRREVARRMWRSLSRRSKGRNQTTKKLLTVYPTYLRPFFAGLFRPRPRQEYP